MTAFCLPATFAENPQHLPAPTTTKKHVPARKKTVTCTVPPSCARGILTGDAGSLTSIAASAPFIVGGIIVVSVRLSMTELAEITSRRALSYTRERADSPYSDIPESHAAPSRTHHRTHLPVIGAGACLARYGGALVSIFWPGEVILGRPMGAAPAPGTLSKRCGFKLRTAEMQCSVLEELHATRDRRSQAEFRAKLQKKNNAALGIYQSKLAKCSIMQRIIVFDVMQGKMLFFGRPVGPLQPQPQGPRPRAASTLRSAGGGVEVESQRSCTMRFE
eukprot:gene6167-biopygen2845